MIGVVARRRDLLVGEDRVDRVDHVVGGELVAVVERDVLAQSEFQRRLVHPLEGFGEQRLDLECLRIAIDERIPDLMAEHDAGAKLVVVRRDVGDGVAPGDTQRVGRFLCQRRCCHRQRRRRAAHHREPAHRLLSCSLANRKVSSGQGQGAALGWMERYPPRALSLRGAKRRHRVKPRRHARQPPSQCITGWGCAFAPLAMTEAHAFSRRPPGSRFCGGVT